MAALEYPVSIYFWNTKNKITTGKMAITAPAMISWLFMVAWPANVFFNWASPTVSIRLVSFLAMIFGQK